MRKRLAWIVVAATVGGIIPAALGLFAPAGQADMIDTSGMATWEHCALCHSADGVSRMDRFPKLAGQRKAYIVKQLGDFRARHRVNDGGPMVTNAGALTDAQIAEVATYFSALPPPPPENAELDFRVVASGKRIFEEGKTEAGVAACVTCHAGGGKPGLLAPRLEAQHAGYLRKQLMDFRAGARTNDPDGVMRGVAAGLNEREISAVAAYVATLKWPERPAP